MNVLSNTKCAIFSIWNQHYDFDDMYEIIIYAIGNNTTIMGGGAFLLSWGHLILYLTILIQHYFSVFSIKLL